MLPRVSFTVFVLFVYTLVNNVWLLGVTNASAQDSSRLPAQVQTTVIDDAVQTHFATYFNVNQRVVSTSHGIFVVYLKHTHDDQLGGVSRNHWILSRSVDEGNSFQEVFSVAEKGDSNIVGKAPEILTDDSGNLFLVTVMNDQHAHIWRFNAPNWAAPVYHQKNLVGGYAPKFSVRFDADGRQLLLMTAAFLLKIDPETGLVAKSDRIQLLTDGEHAYPQYSFLDLTPDGRLLAAWHTARRDTNYYYDIHYAYSKRQEKYRIWRSPLDQRVLSNSNMPITCDDTGPTPMVNETTEVSLDGTYTNGLNHLIFKGEALHFLHGGKCPADSYVQSRYTRISMFSPSSIHRIAEPDFGGATLRLDSSDGFFCVEDSTVQSPLYLVSHRDQRLIALRSQDNGETWSDYALSDYRSTPGSIYSVTGNFRLQNGSILGVFTEQHPHPPHRLLFFRISAE